MYQKVGPLLMVVAIVFLTASSGLQGQNNRIVTITSSPQLGVETVCDNHNVTLMCHTDQTTGNMITWYWSNQSQHRANITVMAMMTEVVYTCVVSDNEGKANVTVRANETPPHVERIDFFNYIRRHEGSNLTLSAKVSSNIPLLAGYPKWAVDFNLPLPSTAMVDNYTINGTIYSNLTLYELSFENDTGNYTFTAENKCGSSFVYVYIDVKKVTVDGSTKNQQKNAIIGGSVGGGVTLLVVLIVICCCCYRRKGKCCTKNKKDGYNPLLPINGNQDDHIQVPSAPTDLTVETLSHEHIKITWVPVADNGSANVDNFALKVIEMDSGTLAFSDRQLPGNLMVATPGGLKSNTRYRIQLAAVNCAGYSNYVEATAKTLVSELQNIRIGEKARQRPLVQIKDFDSVYSDLSHGAVHKWKEIGLKLGLKSCELNEISADYKDDPEENMKKVFELWKDQSLNPTWKELIAAVERTRLNPQLSQTLRIVHQNEIDDEVQSKDFNDVLTSMAKHWFDFGLKLGIDEIQLNNIMPANTKTFFTNMLQKWWQQTDAVSQTWNHVVSALDAVKLSGLAKIIYDSRIKQADNFVDDDI